MLVRSLLGQRMQFDRLKRREFIALLGGTVTAWPLAVRAQQPLVPIIGYLDSRSSDAMSARLGGFRQGLKETGFTEGENARIVYRWADNRIDRLTEMAAEVVREQVNVIVTTGGPGSALAAKASTTTIPIVFLVGEDPTRLGLVNSLARPSGNLTGINLFTNELEAKRFEFLRRVVPQATHIAIAVNPADATNTENTLRDIGAAARAVGVQIRVFNASTPREIDEGFQAIATDRPEALFVAASFQYPACTTGPTCFVPPSAFILCLS
jgi:putative tryptophan/tyrosine transport system substrate-binding protein